jgi:hypothetical protein
VPEAGAVELEYYYGPSLYVAPVVRRGATSRSLWLPPGRWIDWWTLAPLDGGQMITREAPLDVIPLYLRSGGIVALLDPSIETLAPEQRDDIVGLADVAGVLDVRAAIDAATGTGGTTLADGTVLDLSLGAGPVALPADFTVAADEAALSTCAACGLIEPLAGGGTRVRLSTASEVDGAHQAGALTLHHHAGAGLRARWDVVVLP